MIERHGVLIDYLPFYTSDPLKPRKLLAPIKSAVVVRFPGGNFPEDRARVYLSGYDNYVVFLPVGLVRDYVKLDSPLEELARQAVE